jgi:hypothetical protein
MKTKIIHYLSESGDSVITEKIVTILGITIFKKIISL